jgi:hypothetical protein
MQGSTYPSKVDRWLAVVVLAGVLVSALAAVELLRAGEWGIALLMMGIWAGVALVAVPTSYTLTSTELIVRSGLIRWRLPLDGIRRVYPTRNPLSSPAWSLDRLAVEYGASRMLLISPARKTEFLQDLQVRAGLESRGVELARPRAGGLDVPGVNLGLSAEEIASAVREAREREGGGS